MNSLIILAHECVDHKRAVLEGERARYACETHEVKAGVVCRIAVLGGLRGEGLVVEATSLRVVLQLSLSLPALERRPLDLIVGVPRPQTVKKVIQAAAMLGVRSVHFVKSELGEKSYLQSRSLREEELRLEGIKALEQVWDSQLPDVQVHHSFRYFMDTKVPLLVGSRAVCCLVAHPSGKLLSVQEAASTLDEHVVAIGPERGWSENEIGTFRERAFDVVSLGCRIVRVEVATTILIAQLQLLQSGKG